MKKWTGRSLACLLAAVLCFAFLPDISLASEGTETVETEVEYRQTEARSMLEMINDFRTGDEAWYWSEDNSTKIYAEDLGELTYDYGLEQIAMQRAAEIALSFSHTRPDGTSWSTLIDGYLYPISGENLAAGFTSAESAFAGWSEEYEDFAGQGHRRAMLREYFTAVGIACVYYNGIFFWVQEFGSADSGTPYTEADDSVTTVDVDILLSGITSLELGLETDVLTVTEGGTAGLPEVSAVLRMAETWPEDGYCSVTPVNYTWETGDDAYAVITGDTVEGVRAGETTLTVSALGMETSITLIVEESHGHIYGNPVFEWSDDHMSCMAVFTCEDGDDSQEVECVVTSVDNGDGTVTHTAVTGFNGTSYEDILTEEQAGETPKDPSAPGNDTDTEEPADESISSGGDTTGEDTVDDGLSSVIPDDGADTGDPPDEGTSSGDDATGEEPADDGTSSGTSGDNADTEEPGNEGTATGNDTGSGSSGEDDNTADVPDENDGVDGTADDGSSTSADDGASVSIGDTSDDGSSQASGSDEDGQTSESSSSISSGAPARTDDNSNADIWFMLLAAGAAAAVSGIRRKKGQY